jgi:hypothetical protein
VTAEKWWWEYYEPKPVNWQRASRVAWFVIENWARIMNGEQPQTPSQQAPPQQASADLAVALTPAEAANVLGVDVDASADEIRAALRAKMSAGRVHPDHGGDERVATRLVAAKNLLVERARRKS